MNKALVPGMDLSWVELRARDIQNELWRERAKLWGTNFPTSPLGVLQPGVGLKLLGYGVESVPSLGEMNHQGVRGEVAGLIDHDRKAVQISQRPSAPVQLFTAAHELGHAELHPKKGVAHRDLPLGAAGVVRNRQEIEANRFASCFLMPEKHLREAFRARFDCDQFELSDGNAYALFGTFDQRQWTQFRSRRQLSQYLAGAESYNGHRLVALTSAFRVSNLAMAIRLEELGLVA